MSAIPLRVGIALMGILALSEMPKKCYFAAPNGQTMGKRVRNLQYKFEGDPTVNESEITVLPEQV